jgi:hypothetical protein
MSLNPSGRNVLELDSAVMHSYMGRQLCLTVLHSLKG